MTTSARAILTQSEARDRAARISGCAYVLDLAIEAGAATYRGDVRITFADSGSGDTFLYIRGKTIERLEVNGQDVDARLERLPPHAAGRRARSRRTSSASSTRTTTTTTGDGFHQFIDPEDGEEYLYTNFEPYEAHRLFPCFDQPDIKATLHAHGHAHRPNGRSSRNAAETAATPAGDGRTRHTFETTKPFSTYLFALIAGPYHAFRDDARRHPARLLLPQVARAARRHRRALRRSRRQGLDFYADFFDYPYPFGKYDQIFVPEFNAGAMENVGAVTHTERMVFRDPPTDNQRRGRAEVILHEMAHMWFGDLVTMRWWNDLWLNESFATYMAYLAHDRGDALHERRGRTSTPA